MAGPFSLSNVYSEIVNVYECALLLGGLFDSHCIIMKRCSELRHFSLFSEKKKWWILKRVFSHIILVGLVGADSTSRPWLALCSMQQVQVIAHRRHHGFTM